MRIKKKPTAWGLFGLWVLWEAVGRPIWNLNIERVAERNRIDGTLADTAPMTLLREIAAYVPSSFTAGFVIGALLFAYWDNILAGWRKLRGKAADPDLRVWLGRVVPHFDPEHRRLSLWFHIINLGEETLFNPQVEGGVFLKADRIFNLTSPRVDSQMAEAFENGQFGPIVVEFDVPAKFWATYPDVFQLRNPPPSIDFNDLRLTLRTTKGLEKKVPLWESMRMTSGEGQVCAVQTYSTFRNEDERTRYQAALDAFRR